MANLSQSEAKDLLYRGWIITHESWKPNEYIRFIGKNLVDQDGTKFEPFNFFKTYDHLYDWSKFDTNKHIRRQDIRGSILNFRRKRNKNR